MFHGEQPQHADMTLLEEMLRTATNQGVRFVSLQVCWSVSLAIQ